MLSPRTTLHTSEQVLDYARSVEAASRDISKEAEIELTDELLDQLVLVAAVRKLHAICSSSYWLLYNSTKLLGDEVTGVRSEAPPFLAGAHILIS